MQKDEDVISQTSNTCFAAIKSQYVAFHRPRSSILTFLAGRCVACPPAV